MMMPELHKS